MNSLWGIKGAAGVAGGSGSLWQVKRGILAFFGILGLWVYVSAGSEGMVHGSRAVGVSWDMGMAQGLCVGVCGVGRVRDSALYLCHEPP